MIPPGIANIIFDLGGVILNLSTSNTVEEFAKLANTSAQEVSARLMEARQFHEYEKGRLTDADFRDSVRQLLKINATDSQIDLCWNAMLLDIPANRLALLQKLRRKYRLFLLSNTNEIHLTRFSQILQETANGNDFDHYFEVAYYSHRLKMRKPDREIYEFVLSQNNLEAAATIFLDDNLANLEGARMCGIQTYHIGHPDQLFTFFS